MAASVGRAPTRQAAWTVPTARGRGLGVRLRRRGRFRLSRPVADSAGFASPVAVASSVAGARRAACAPPPWKSVSYQPLPFNWKPAADTSLVSASLRSAGT